MTLVQALFVGDLSLLNEVGQALIKGVHSVRGSGLHDRVDLMGLTLANQISDRGSDYEHLSRHDASLSV
jgi:hypothetical protein